MTYIQKINVSYRSIRKKKKKKQEKWAKDLIFIPQKVDIQIANKHKKQDSISWIREIQN